MWPPGAERVRVEYGLPRSVTSRRASIMERAVVDRARDYAVQLSPRKGASPVHLPAFTDRVELRNKRRLFPVLHVWNMQWSKRNGHHRHGPSYFPHVEDTI